MGDLKGVVSTGLRAARTRLELLALEVKEEKAWTVRFIWSRSPRSTFLPSAAPRDPRRGAVRLGGEPARDPRDLCRGLPRGGRGRRGVVVGKSKKRHPLFDETIAVLKGDEQGLRELMRGTSD
jgi:hypothetical protein